MLTRSDYKAALRPLRLELCKAQRHIAATGRRVLVIVEGRDASGKGGLIRCVVRRLDPGGVSVVRLPKPTPTERGQWYFQRYVRHLPGSGELSLFDRSWYNRAGLEPVMGYCSPQEAEAFLEDVPVFEGLLVRSGLQIIKLYLTISREEQARRLAERAEDPLTRWRMTPIDRAAGAKWEAYTRAEATIFRRTSTREAPWVRVIGDDKRQARLDAIRALLSRLEYPDTDASLTGVDPERIKLVPST